MHSPFGVKKCAAEPFASLKPSWPHAPANSCRPPVPQQQVLPVLLKSFNQLAKFTFEFNMDFLQMGMAEIEAFARSTLFSPLPNAVSVPVREEQHSGVACAGIGNGVKVRKGLVLMHAFNCSVYPTCKYTCNRRSQTSRHMRKYLCSHQSLIRLKSTPVECYASNPTCSCETERKGRQEVPSHLCSCMSHNSNGECEEAGQQRRENRSRLKQAGGPNHCLILCR